MAFVQVDPSQIKFDAPQLSQAANGFVSVDPTKIQFDQPQSGAPSQNVIEQIGSSSLGNAVGDVIDQTGQILKNIPNQNPASSGLQIVGQGAKMIAMPAGQVIAAAIPDSARQGAQSTASAIDSTGVGKAIGDKLLQAKDYYNNFTQAHPEISGDVGAGLNIASTLQGGNAATQAVDDIKTGVSNAANGARGLADAYAAKYPSGTAPFDSIEPKTTPTIDQVNAAAKIRYQNAEQMGGLINPSGTDSLIANIKQKVGYQTPEGRAFAGDNMVTQTMNQLDALKGQPISLAGLDEIDGTLQSKISQAANAGDKESMSKLYQIRDTLRNASSSLSPDDLVNPQAFDEWKAGDTLWSAKSKMQDLQNIVDNAYNTDNPATAMKTGYRNLYKRLVKNSSGYTPEEIDAVNQAAKTGVIGGALKVAGSRLISGVVGTVAGAASGGGALGALKGAAIGEAAAYPLRAASNAIQESRAAAPMNMVAMRPGVLKAFDSTNKYTTKKPLQLSYQPQDKTVFVNSRGSAITEADRDILGQSPSLNSVMQLASPKDKTSFSASWDKLTTAQQNQISAQTEKMWRNQQTPLADMIAQSKQAVDDLAAATGSDIKNPSLRDALLNSVKDPTMQEIMKMPPSQARNAFANYRSRSKP